MWVQEPAQRPGQACDLAGRIVRTLVNGQQQLGSYSVHWDGRDAHGHELANGVHFVRLTAGGYTITEKLVLQR